MIRLRRWIYLAIFLFIFYYIFIENIFITLGVIASLVIAFNLYKFYARWKINKLVNSKDEFKKSQLGLFISLVAKVAKADGRVQELEAQLIGMMFDDISKLFNEKDKARALMKEIFNESKEKTDDIKKIAHSLNLLLGRSRLKRRQYMGFLIQLAFIDNGISSDEDMVLRQIMTELNISTMEYDAILNSFESRMKNKPQSMSETEAYKILGVNQSDDMDTIKKAYRKLIRKYHPDIVSSQDKGESYMEEATAKTQEINQAYEAIKKARKV